MANMQFGPADVLAFMAFRRTDALCGGWVGVGFFRFIPERSEGNPCPDTCTNEGNCRAWQNFMRSPTTTTLFRDDFHRLVSSLNFTPVQLPGPRDFCSIASLHKLQPSQQQSKLKKTRKKKENLPSTKIG